MQSAVSTDQNPDAAQREFWLRVCTRAEALAREIISIEMLLQGQSQLADEVRHDN